MAGFLALGEGALAGVKSRRKKSCVVWWEVFEAGGVSQMLFFAPPQKSLKKALEATNFGQKHFCGRSNRSEESTTAMNQEDWSGETVGQSHEDSNEDICIDQKQAKDSSGETVRKNEETKVICRTVGQGTTRRLFRKCEQLEWADSSPSYFSQLCQDSFENPAVSTVGFSIASSVRSFWMNGVAGSLDSAAEAMPAISAPLTAASSAIKLSDGIAESVLQVSSFLTWGSLTAVDSSLQQAGFTHSWEAGGSETATALLHLGNVLGEFSRQHNDPNISLRQLWTSYHLLKDLHEEPPPEASAETDQRFRVSDTPVADLHWGMRLAAAAYGWKAQHVLGTLPSPQFDGQPITSDPAAMMAQTGLNWERDIILSERSSELHRPGYFLALDRKHKKVVIAIRGTVRAADVVTDLVCQSEIFQIPVSADGTSVRPGRVHRGFLKGAKRMAELLEGPVREALTANANYQLTVVGHSLGAGVGTVLTLLWAQQVPLFRERNIFCLAFAPPCTLCPMLAAAPFTQKYVQSIALGNDIVCRLSYGSVSELYHKLVALAHLPRDDPTAREQAKQIAHAAVPGAEATKLHVAGMVWHIHPTSTRTETESEVVIDSGSGIGRVSSLQSIILSSDMFSVHMPNRYLQQLATGSLSAGRKHQYRSEVPSAP
eukprot:g8248.t1